MVRAALAVTGGVLLPRFRVKKSPQFLFMESSLAKTLLPLSMLGEDGGRMACLPRPDPGVSWWFTAVLLLFLKSPLLGSD